MGNGGTHCINDILDQEHVILPDKTWFNLISGYVEPAWAIVWEPIVTYKLNI